MDLSRSGLRMFLFCLVIPLAATPWSRECDAQVVISQVYGGGGNSGSTLKNDFVELFNAGNSPVALDGWSVEYASASSSSWSATPLHGMLQPGVWYLVEEAKGSAGTVDLPTPDAKGTTNISGTAGKVALLDSAVLLTDSLARNVHVKDLVGWGNANGFEGSGPGPATTSKTALMRLDSGRVDANDNAHDFAVRPPNPRNTQTLPLPIELVSLHAAPAPGGGILVTWTTLSEVNNYGFFVERETVNDSIFCEVTNSFCPGHGTVVGIHDYEFLDSSSSVLMTCRYRLRQVDLSGAVHYSESVGVLTTGISPVARLLSFSLAQNFPNPCNPSTIIAYTIAGDLEKGRGGERVRLSVYDLLGREVAVLVDGYQTPGEHRVTFDARSLASGIYFYRLVAGGQSLSRKLVLLK